MRTANMGLAICFFAYFLLGTNGNPVQPVEMLSGPTGSFSSPNHPGVYDNNLKRKWTIQVRPGHHIKFRFTSFNLEDSYDQIACVYDYVLVTEGTKTIGRFCGKAWSHWDAPTPNDWFFSKGREVHFEFVSDFSNEDISPTGFKAYYFEEDNDECAEMKHKIENTIEDWDELVICDHFCHNTRGSFYCSCRIGYRLHSNQKTCVAIADCLDQELTADEGIIKSPDYPNPYAKLSHCTWDIRVRDGLSVHLTFNSEFEVEQHDDKEYKDGCVYDILEISYNDNKDTYCGTTAPKNGTVMDMNTKKVTIDFTTDLAVEGKGFRIMYNTSRIRCLHPLTDPANGTKTTNLKGYYEFEDVVDYTCNTGYDLMGDSRLECLSDGKWNNQQPTCKIISCGRPDNLTSVDLFSVKNSHIVGKRFEYMEIVTVACNEWYELKAGSPTWRCNESKVWVKTAEPRAPNPPFDIPQCRPSNCGEVCIDDRVTDGSCPMIAGSEKEISQECGKRLVQDDPFAVQGAGAKPVKKHGGWPWMVFVDLGGGRNGKNYCGGTLVDEKTVVTAAHCVQPIDVGETVVVWLGLLDRTSDDFNFTQRFIVPFDKIIIEDSYTKNVGSREESFDGDIAILKLNRSANLSYYVHPICVPTPLKQEALISAYKIGTDFRNFVVTGWGKDELGIFSQKLMKTRVGVVNHESCKILYNERFRRNDQITENMICAGSLESRNDACEGDSGGPLMAKDISDTWYLSGIVSFGEDITRCNGTGTYGVYTDVSKYNQFVELNLEINKQP